MEYVLFIGRHNNDIDWATPLIQEYLKNNQNVLYLLTNPFISKTDFRIKYLNKKYKDTFDVLDIFELEETTHYLSKISHSIRNISIAKKIFNRIISKSKVDKDIRKYLSGKRISHIIFDYTCPTHENNKKPPFGAKAIYEYAKSNNIKSFAIPHGLILFELPGNYKCFNKFNLVFSSNAFQKRTLLTGGYSKKLSVSGASRYDIHWLRTLDNIVKLPFYYHNIKDKTIVTFFATKNVYDFSFSNLINWLDKLSDIENIALIIQPHPRGQSKKIFKKLSCKKNVIIDKSTPASVLCRISHATSTLVSSAAIESLVLGKPIVYPRFLHSETTAYDSCPGALTIEQMDETNDINERILNYRPPEELEEFLKIYIYPKGKNTCNIIRQEIEIFNSK